MSIKSDIGVYVCTPDLPIRDVLRRIDASPRLFQVVADGDGFLLGTVTDGDIRRAILRGLSLEDPASACMNANPATGRVGAAEENAARLARLGSSHPFLPILDADGRLVDILLPDGVRDAGIERAFVLAGGFGKRLGERTKGTPKPLLPVGGRPILDHVLSALENAGVSRVDIAVHYLADQIRAFVAGRDNRADITFVEEEAPLGTAGALGLLAERPRGPLLVVNGDVITRADFAALHEFHVRHGNDATLGVASYDIDVPFGVVRFDEDGLFDHVEEKPRISHFIAAGVYYLSPEYLALVQPGRPLDMPALLNAGKEIGLRAGLFPIHEYWTDVGQPADLDAADRDHGGRGGQDGPAG